MNTARNAWFWKPGTGWGISNRMPLSPLERIRPDKAKRVLVEGLGTPAEIRLTFVARQSVVLKGGQQNRLMIPYSRKKVTL